MTREDFFRAFGEINERFVEETVKDFENGIFYEEGIGMSVWRKVCLAAACFALVAVGTLVIYIRSRSEGVPTPPLSGNPVLDSISEVTDSSDDSYVFGVYRWFKWLKNFDYNDFYVEPNADIKPFGGFEKDDSPICTLNNKNSNPNVFCYGGGKIYFYLNGYVYEYDPSENKAVKLFEGIAYDLNYRDGMLYYVVDPEYKFNSRDVASPSGELFRYNLATKEPKQLTDFDVQQLVVTDDGIYFVYVDYIRDDGKTGYVHMFTINEETGECERLYTNFSYIEYGGYRLKLFVSKDATEDDPSPFVFEKDGVQYAMPKGFNPNRDCICGDNYYFVANDGHALNRMDMLTGEITAEVYDEVDADGTKRLVCVDYTVLDGEMYYLDGSGMLWRYDEESGEAKSYSFELPVNGGLETVYMRYIYSDGGSIYAVTGSTNGPGGYNDPGLVRIDKDGGNLKPYRIVL